VDKLDLGDSSERLGRRPRLRYIFDIDQIGAYREMLILKTGICRALGRETPYVSDSEDRAGFFAN
jgi:hypothetical protein